MGGIMSKRGQFTPSPQNQRPDEDHLSGSGSNQQSNNSSKVVGDATGSPENPQYEINSQLTNFTTSLLHVSRILD